MGCGNSRVQPNVSKQAQQPNPSAKPKDKGGQQQAADPRNGAPKAAADPLSGPPKAAAKPGVPSARSSKTSALPPVGLKRGSVAPEPVSSAAQERGSDSGAPGPGSWPGSEKGAKPSGSGGDTLVLRSEPRTARTDVTQRGVSLAFLQRMITSGAVQAKWSVDEVVDRYIKPKTRAAWCPLFDLTPDECTTGKPSCFVSHAWSCSFGDLVSMLTGYSKQVASGARGSPAGSSLTLWIDIVCVNQHLHADHACLLTDDVMKVVDGTKQTLYCLDASFAALRRTWCLYEVWTTFVIKGAAGLTVLVTDTSGMKEAFDSFDVLQSRASRTKDHVRLLAAIQSNISAEQLNLQFKDALVESAVHEAEHFAAQTEKLEQARSETKAADLHFANGEHWEAERHYRLALQGYEAAGSKGRQGEDAVGVLCLLAACVGAQGFTRAEEAEELLREALAACTRLHGPEDKTTLSMLSHLAGCLHTRDPRSAEAEALHRQALEAQERTLGPDHPHTITTCANLANLLQTTQRYAEAEPLYRRALAARVDAMGSKHPEALSALYVLAVCVKEQGRFGEAEAMHREVMEVRSRVLGPEHLDTLSSANQLALALFAQQRFAESAPLFSLAAEGRKRFLGPDHPHVVEALYSLAASYLQQQLFEDAEPIFRSVIEVRGRCYPDTPGYGDAMYNLAGLLIATERYEEAVQQLEAAAGVYVRVYGPTHPESQEATAKAKELREAMESGAAWR